VAEWCSLCRLSSESDIRPGKRTGLPSFWLSLKNTISNTRIYCVYKSIYTYII
jgi:hypothetical protein